MRPLVVLVSLSLLATTARAQAPVEPVETPSLSALVGDGTLPPVAERLPEEPRVVTLAGPGLRPGRSGGEITMLMGRAKDVRMMVVYGYARLVCYDAGYELAPDILADVKVERGRRFTLTLRRGHRWSDGHPFTAEDFRYWWEDVANHPRLSPTGPPRVMIVNGEKPLFEVLDETRVRYTWSSPNPDFLPALAGARPVYIYSPAHYLKRFHERYADADALKARAHDAGQRNWAALHNRKDNLYRNDNPELPTLQPWMTRTRPPAQRFEFERNPYYHRIDTQGRQLPYLDRVVFNIAAGSIIPAKTGAGESDLQARGLSFGDYTFLKKGERRGGYHVRLWRTAKGAHIALFPNLNVNDDAWRAMFRDVRFRRALSLGIDRHEINQVVYFGLTIEGNNTVLPQSPLYKPSYTTKWARFDPAAANRLLDEMGLTKRDEDGVRLLPDGRPMQIIVETAGEDTEQTDVLELIRDSWRKLGIRLYSRPSQRDVFRNRIYAGETMMSVWSGYENGVPTADTSPDEFVPTAQDQLQWPKWGQYFQTRGKVGVKPDLPAAETLMELYRAWRSASETEERRALWHRILALHADRAFTIGVVAGVPQPVVVNNRLRNVPDNGVYNWDPGAHFGIYRPDTFWLARRGER